MKQVNQECEIFYETIFLVSSKSPYITWEKIDEE